MTDPSPDEIVAVEYIVHVVESARSTEAKALARVQVLDQLRRTREERL